MSHASSIASRSGELVVAGGVCGVGKRHPPVKARAMTITSIIVAMSLLALRTSDTPLLYIGRETPAPWKNVSQVNL
jgi:hypothetical protein